MTSASHGKKPFGDQNILSHYQRLSKVSIQFTILHDFFLHTFKNYFTLEHGHPKEFSASIFGPVK